MWWCVLKGKDTMYDILSWLITIEMYDISKGYTQPTSDVSS